jgi:hypothetical protein
MFSSQCALWSITLMQKLEKTTATNKTFRKVTFRHLNFEFKLNDAANYASFFTGKLWTERSGDEMEWN